MLVDCNYTIMELLTEMSMHIQIWCESTQYKAVAMSRTVQYMLYSAPVVWAFAGTQSLRYHGAEAASWR